MAIAAGPSAAACDKVAAPRALNTERGSAQQPYASVGKLANALRPGQTGCLRRGVYRGRVTVKRGGSASAPITIRSAPGERATVRGRIHVANSANHVVFRQLFLDGRNR